VTASSPTDRPLLRLNPGQERRLKSGHPWAYSNEIRMTPDMRTFEKGLPIRLESAEGWRLGTFMFNPNSLIAARLLDRDPNAIIDAAWVRKRLDDAITLRARLGLGPHHRLVHAEADRLPGLIIDRYNDVAVIQANTAGMDRLLPLIIRELTDALPLRAIVARNDSPFRLHEALPQTVELLHGTDSAVLVEEGGIRFPIDPMSGQKTGWFFDQRPNRDRVAALANGARVLDVFCHVGAFGLRCAQAGASAVTLVDSSAPALAHALEGAALNGFADRVAVLAVDPEEAEVGLDGVAAAECLVNHHLGGGGQRGLVARGNLRGGDVAGERAVAVGHVWLLAFSSQQSASSAVADR
jgi:23S rRNA (cytosine1962-C5)-methyltransferase